MGAVQDRLTSSSSSSMRGVEGSIFGWTWGRLEPVPLASLATLLSGGASTGAQLSVMS